MGISCLIPSLSEEAPSGLDLCWPCVCYHSLCEFIWRSFLLYLKGLVPWYLLSPLVLILFLPPLSQSPLSPKGRDLTETSPHLELGVSRSLTLCALPVGGLCICFSSTTGRASLMRTEQDTNLLPKLVWTLSSQVQSISRYQQLAQRNGNLKAHKLGYGAAGHSSITEGVLGMRKTKKTGKLGPGDLT